LISTILVFAAVVALSGCGKADAGTAGSGQAPTDTSTPSAAVSSGTSPAAGTDANTLVVAGVGGGGGPAAAKGAVGSQPNAPTPGTTSAVATPFSTGAAEVVRIAVPVADYPALVDQAVAAKYRPVWIDGYDVGSAVYFNAVFRRDEGTTNWWELIEMSASGYQRQFDAFKAHGYRLVLVESYLNAGQARYAAIWDTSTGVDYYAFHAYTASAYQALFDSKTAAGYLPAQVSVISVGGALSYSGLLIKRSLGASWTLKSSLTPDEYQTLFNSETAAGRGLAYVASYVVNGSVRFVALFAASASAPLRAKHGLTAAAFTSQTTANEQAGFSTRAVSGYAVNGSPSFIAYWSK
jgi:hypothetical protein